MRIGDTVATDPRPATSAARNGRATWQSQGHVPPRRQAHPRHRRPHRRLARVRGRPPRTGAGRRGRSSPAPAAGLSLTQRTARKLPVEADGARARRHRPDAGRRRARRARRRAGAGSTAPSTPSASPRRRASAATFIDGAVGGRRGGAPGLGLLAQDARRRGRAAHDRRRLDRGPRLRQQHVRPGPPTTGWAWPRPPSSRTSPLPGPRPRPPGHPGEPRGRRPDQDAGRQVDPRLLRGSRTCGTSAARSAGT